MWLSFTIGYDGSLTVTVYAHQVIAVHTGAQGRGESYPRLVQQIPVLFYENATTTFGEVGVSFGCGFGTSLLILAQ